MNKKTDSILLDGVRSALIAFLIVLGISLVLSVIVNFSVYEQFNELMSGNLGGNKGVTLNSIVKITMMIFNFSLFNTVGSLKFGALVFIFIPGIAFYIANKQIDKKGALDLTNIYIYLVASGILAVLQFCISLITKGEIVGELTVNFATFGNFITTVIITFLIQLFIKLNYKLDAKNSGVKAFNYTYRIMVVIGLIVGLVAIIVGLTSYRQDIILMLFAIILILPNAIAYTFFYMTGLTMAFNDELQGALNLVGLDPTLQNMMYIRYIAIVVFVLIIIWFVFRMNKEKLIVNTMIYSVSLSVFIGTLAYCSSINVVNIPFIGNIEFSVSNLFLSALIPFIIVWLIVLIYYLIKKAKEIIMQ